MTLNSIPPLPPSFSHDTIQSIHSLYETPILFTSSSTSFSSVDDVRHDADHSFTSIPSLPESPLSIPSNSSHPLPFPSSLRVNPMSQVEANPSSDSRSFEEVDPQYRSGCSLDVEISSNRQSFSTSDPSNVNMSKVNTDPTQPCFNTSPLARQDLNIQLQDESKDLEAHPRFQQLLEENASLRLKLAQAHSPSNSPHLPQKNLFHGESNFPKEILNIMATQILQFKQHIELKSKRFHHEPLTLWFTAFSSRLKSMENPTEKQVLTIIEEFFYHVQAHLDTWLLLTTIQDGSILRTSTDLPCTTENPFSSSSSSSLSSLYTISSSSSSSIESKDNQGATKNEPPLGSPSPFFPSTSIPCVSCLRLRNALETQTQALTTVCSEKEKKEHDFLTQVSHFERVFQALLQKDEPKEPMPILASPSVPTTTATPVASSSSSSSTSWTLSLSNLESHLLTTFQSHQEHVKKLEGEVQALRASKLKLKSELKQTLSELQTQSMLLDSKYTLVQKEGLEWRLKYEKQVELTNDLKKKIKGIKKILQQLEQRAVDEVIKHKSTKDLCDQLRLRIKTLSENQEKYKTDLVLSQEYAQKLNSTLERQTRYLQVLKSKPSISEETLHLQQSLEEHKRSLEETQTKWMHEKTVRQRNEAKMQSLQCKIDLLQKLLNEKEPLKSSTCRSHIPLPSKDAINERKPSVSFSSSSSYLINQYKLAITDFVQWLYSFYTPGPKVIKKKKSILTYPTTSPYSVGDSLGDEPFSLNVPKTLVDQLSNHYLHIPYDELVLQLQQSRQELPSQALTTIFSSRKNVRSLLFQFLKQCTDEVFQFHEFSLFHSKVHKDSISNSSNWIS